MIAGMSTKPTSRKRAAVLLRAAFEALDGVGGNMRLKDLFREVERRVDLQDYDRQVYEKSGYVRWQSVLHFYSVDCVKAGFLKKAGGMWWLTPEGRAAMTLPPDEMLDRAMRAYRVWRAQRVDAVAADVSVDGIPSEDVRGELDTKDPDRIERSFVFETAEAQAKQEIVDYIQALGPYEMQDLVAALLRGMGYTTPYVAPKGPDGGTDILAYRDPLGIGTPHMRVQVKHRKDKASRDEIAALRGIVRPDREVGLFVSTHGFTSDAVREARSGTAHVELIDLDRFLDLWLAQYDRLSEDDKSLLRLRKVYFLAPD